MPSSVSPYDTLVKSLKREDILTEFPEIIPLEKTTGASSTISSTESKKSEIFSGHDEEQIKLMDENCIVLDYNDIPIGAEFIIKLRQMVFGVNMK
ncbi:unnamed protein product [[Candida] boidinii]|nr:unnamed protein product [[Candida] boidinii]